MIQPMLSHELPALEAPKNVSRTSDYEIAEDARDAYAAVLVEVLDRADDMPIALEIRLRQVNDSAERIEIDNFIRERGYEPSELRA